ncbi:unnamed protein product [Echinostoma caproni]|uniref:Protein kinase domain-containing protein n=1 Tax=Echinostoma caproni TaxID=27848 RepID=A0A183A9Z8_9TREM|nr:unnamed protein product [Echinostoma caproni]
MDGTCYRASLEVFLLPYGGKFLVDVRSQMAFNGAQQMDDDRLAGHLNYSFWILKNALSNFMPDNPIDTSSEDSDFLFPELGFKDYHVLDEFDHFLEFDGDPTSFGDLNSNTHPSEAESKQPTSQLLSNSSSQTTTSPSLPQVQTPVKSSDASVMNDTGSTHLSSTGLDYPQLEFFAHNTHACIGDNQTVDCRFFRMPILLELWFLRPLPPDTAHGSCSETCTALGCFDQPQLLKTSRVQEYRIVNSRSGLVNRAYQFDDNVAATITGLGRQHSGLYMCKAGHIYRTIKVEVVDCSPSEISFIPLILIIFILLITMAILTVTFMICIRARRKPIIAIWSSPSMLQHKVLPGSGTKKLTVISRLNKLYPLWSGETNNSLLYGSYKKSALVSQSKRSLMTVQMNKQRDCLLRKPSRVFRPATRFVQSDPRWEVPRARIEIDQLLGQGNFGVVYRGVVRGRLPGRPCSPAPCSNSTNVVHKVAIKTMKDNYTTEDLMDLIRELETMKLLNSHPHVIQLLGACTQQGPLMILMEYAVHGNLRDYLRKHRAHESDLLREYNHDSESPSPSADSSSDQSVTNDYPRLDIRLLLRFANHVASALTYFESLNLAHRDIAARNVLVCEGYNAKLGDFGFARLIDDCDYRDIDRDQLPYKWIAPECFENNQYSLKSDIWSFGILLWELFSLGETPYPGVSTADLPEWLAAGNRNTQPLLADLTLFNLMLRCWAAEPTDRPTSKDIQQELLSYSFGNQFSPMRQSSRDSGFCSMFRSHQPSLRDSGLTEVLPDVDAPPPILSVPRKPMPPVRICSLSLRDKSSFSPHTTDALCM